MECHRLNLLTCKELLDAKLATDVVLQKQKYCFAKCIAALGVKRGAALLNSGVFNCETLLLSKAHPGRSCSVHLRNITR